MATTNLGRVKPIHRGVYDPDFLYTPLDIVRYQGASYFCIKASQGNVPQDGEFFMAIVDGDLRYAQTAGGADANFAEAPQIDGQSLDDRYQKQVAGKGLSTNDYTDNEKSKLEGIEVEATKNATDTYLLNRENHTGTQTLETISDAGTAAAADVEDFDAAGTSVAVMQAHTSEDDPHDQYARKEDIGSAAGRDASDFDPAGSAANAVEAHERELNPHSQYARLAEPNDFSHMPTVQGDPVVESGSNSDGEWTRWADGTQVCGRRVTETISTTAYFNVFAVNVAIVAPYAAPFIELPTEVETARSSELISVVFRGGNVSGVSELRYYSPNALTDQLVHVTVLATGRWK